MYYWHDNQLVHLIPATEKEVIDHFYAYLDSAKNHPLFERDLHQASKVLSMLEETAQYNQLQIEFDMATKECQHDRQLKPLTGPRNFSEAMARHYNVK